MSTQRDGRALHGANHTIDIRGGWAHARVFKREDVGLDEGARFAMELGERLRQLAHESAIRGLVLDIREAPTIAGPRTREHVAELCAAWEHAGRPVAIVTGDEPIKHVQFQTIVTRFAPRWARVVAHLEEGMAWLGQARTAPGDQDG